MAWLPTLLLASLVFAMTMALRPSASRNHRLATILAAGAIPLVAPTQAGWLRFLLAAYAVVFAAKAWERSKGRVHDPEMWESPGRYLFWWAVPPDARTPKNAVEAAQHRAAGRKRILRASAKAVAVVLIVTVNRQFPALREHDYAHALWSMALLYPFISGITDLVSGLAMQGGLFVEETFVAPAFSRSPREFWGQRWNRFISRFAFRNVFIPLGGIRHPFAATMAVFLFSGVMHEYLILVCGRGLGSYTGQSVAFFVVHGLAVAIQGRRRGRLPRPVAAALHLGWLVWTAPLFFRPLDEAVRYSEWWT